jgi:hypothetical protein
MTDFDGWPADATAFLAELAQDNTREFWTANAQRHRHALRDPTLALAAALAPEFGPARVFRPVVDRRFRPHAAPYRTDTGVVARSAGGTPYAAVLSVQGLAVQVGYQVFDAAQRRRYRAAVDGAVGAELEDVLGALRAGPGLVPDGVPALTGRPRGCAPDHPRLPLLRLCGLHVDRAWPAGDWLGTAEPLERVRGAWRAARPLADWLDVHVGPRDAGRQPEADHAPPDGPC